MNKHWEADNHLLESAVASLRASTGFIVEAKTFAREAEPTLILKETPSSPEFKYKILMRRRLSNEAIWNIAAELTHKSGQPKILVTTHISPSQAKILREAQAQFIDAAGNALIRRKNLLILISGNRAQVKLKAFGPPRAFTAAGVKVTFALLSCPTLVAATYREIAAAAGVSLGAINPILLDLKQSGYLIDQGSKGRVIHNHFDLIRRWSEAYAERLRPKIVLGRFHSDRPNWWKAAHLKEMNACWGGEVAAAELTNYLRPQNITIYGPGKLPSLQVKHSFRAAPDGNIELLKKFWSFEATPFKPEIAPVVLIYADLMTRGDDRNKETAQLLYDRYLS